MVAKNHNENNSNSRSNSLESRKSTLSKTNNKLQLPDIKRKRGEPESLNSPIRIKNRIYRITEKGNSVISQPFYGKDSADYNPLIGEDEIFVDKKRLI